MSFKRIPNETAVNSSFSPGRRDFFGKVAAAAATVAGSASLGTKAASALGLSPEVKNEPASGHQRQTEVWDVRVEAARSERHRPVADHSNNGDEDRYPNKIANFSKGLPHNLFGEVDLA